MTTNVLPRAKARAERQRWALRTATKATGWHRQRSTQDHATVVLAALASRVLPVSLSGGWLTSHTGLTEPQIGAALVRLESGGQIAPSSRAAGRADPFTPAVLGTLGLDAYALGWDVLPDVDPPGPEPSAALLGERTGWIDDNNQEEDNEG